MKKLMKKKFIDTLIIQMKKSEEKYFKNFFKIFNYRMEKMFWYMDIVFLIFYFKNHFIVKIIFWMINKFLSNIFELNVLYINIC